MIRQLFATFFLGYGFSYPCHSNIWYIKWYYPKEPTLKECITWRILCKHKLWFLTVTWPNSFSFATALMIISSCCDFLQLFQLSWWLSPCYMVTFSKASTIIEQDWRSTHKGPHSIKLIRLELDLMNGTLNQFFM